ncbi:MAG: cation:proton antiporter, partial [Acidimicrobiales bacterium]
MSAGALLGAAGSNLDEITARLFVCMAVIVVIGRLVGAAFRRFGQPAVLGEIVAGIALGPSLLGLAPGNLPERLFPLEVRPYLRVVAELGLVIFMFIVGLEIDLGAVARTGRRAVVISLSSIVVPFALGAGVLAPLLYTDHRIVDGEAVRFLGFALFMGVSMCATAFAILARILSERNMFRIPLGMLLISCAAIDDVVAFSLLAVVLSVVTSGGLLAAPLRLVELIALAVVLHKVVKPLLERRVAVRWRAEGRLDPQMLGVLLVGVLASAALTHHMGVHALIGAFLFGTATPRGEGGRLFHEITERLEGVSVVLLLPVFFVVTGLGVDIGGLGWSGVLPALGVLAVACLGKFAGGAGAARLMGVPPRQSLAVGVMMNTRGLAELVILNVGRSMGVLDDQMFTMLVIMAVVTTVMAGPLLRAVYPDRWLERDIAEAERLRLGGGSGPRVMIAADRAEDAEPLVELALAALDGEPDAELNLLSLTGPRAGGGAASLAELAAGMARFEELRRQVRARGFACEVTVRGSGDVAGETLAHLASAAPHLVIGSPGAEAIGALVESAPCDVAVVSGRWRAGATVALAAGSGRHHAAALELAARLGRAGGGPVQVFTPAGGRARPAAALRALEQVGVAAAVGGPDPD